MRKYFLVAGICLFTVNLFAQNVCISTPGTSLVLSAPTGGDLRYVYYGNKLSETDVATINQTGSDNYSAYPVYGLGGASEAALAVKHADGNMTLQMTVTDVKTNQEGNANITIVKMKDKVYPFFANICYKAYQDVDIIEVWTEIPSLILYATYSFILWGKYYALFFILQAFLSKD